MLCIGHWIIGLRHLDTKKIGAKLFGEPRNVVLEENGEDKTVREGENRIFLILSSVEKSTGLDIL